MKKNALLLFCALTLGASLSMAKSKTRKPSALDCDKSKVSSYLKENIFRYKQMVAEEKLSVDEAHSLISGLNDLVEMQSLACNWSKVKPEPKVDACERNHIDQVRWEKMLENELLTQEEYKSLVAGQKEISSFSTKKCN